MLADEGDTDTKTENTQIVVTANRIETERSKTGSSVTVIDKKQIERSSRQTVADVLRGQKGVDVVQTGGPGGNTSVFLRGANSEHTLILIDGIEANNPINNSRSFNFNDLSLESVERIEIIRGPQSTIYGSDALGGVINIITKKGSNTATTSITAEAGSYSLFRESANTSGKVDKFSYAIGAQREDFGNISSANVTSEDADDDRFQNTGATANFGLELNDNLKLNSISKFQRSHSSLDNGGAPLGDDPNRYLTNQTFFQKAEIVGNFFNSFWLPTFSVTYSGHSLFDKNDIDSKGRDFLRSNYDANLIKYDLLNTFVVNNTAKIVAGFTSEREKGESDFNSDGDFGPFSEKFSSRSLTTNSGYLQGIFEPIENLSTSIGGRIDRNSRFGTETTWRATSSYVIQPDSFRVLGSIGTGFKAPSLYQLYSQYGSTLLDSEKSLGWDIGFEKSFFDGDLSFESTYFRNSLDNLISFDPNTFIFFNVNEAKTSGLESSIGYNLCDETDFKFVHTYLDTNDESTGQALLRRPNNRYRFEVTTRLIKDTDITFYTITQSSRWDNDFNSFPATRVKLGSYTTANIFINHKLNKQVSLFARLDNLFDKEYEEVLGFSSLGFSVIGGIKVEF